jgi:hypothetical protein
MMDNFDSRRLLLMPALFLGMILGLVTHDALTTPEPWEGLASPGYQQIAGTAGGIYLAATYFVFRLRKPVLGLSPAQFRLGWLGAFVLGALATPMMLQLANR